MKKLIDLNKQENYIKSKGWSTWYNEKYWVHPKTVEDSAKQDFTLYGMDLNSAYCFEKLSLPKFQCSPLPRLSMNLQGMENKKRIQALLKKLEVSK